MRDLDSSALATIASQFAESMRDLPAVAREIERKVPKTYFALMLLVNGMENEDMRVGFFQGYLLALVIALRSETEPEPMKCLGFRILPQESPGGGGP